MTREELCLIFCEGIESNDMEYYISTGRSLLNLVIRIEQLEEGLEIGREEYFRMKLDMLSTDVKN